VLEKLEKLVSKGYSDTMIIPNSIKRTRQFYLFLIIPRKDENANG
jgi:hypothetical protein